MECKNHPGLPALDRCGGCAEPFCANCLVEIQGQKYCGSCKVMLVREQPAAPSQTLVTCQEAKEALILALVGTLCCLLAIILEPIALTRAVQARKQIAAHANLGGAGMALGAMIVAGITLLLAAVNVLYMISSLAQM